MKRQLSDIEKNQVRTQQTSPDGSLRCFVSGEIIADDDEIHFDHVQAFAKDGETSIANIRIVLKKYNLRKGDQSLHDVRDNLALERLFISHKNNIRLQDIFSLKEIHKRNTHSTFGNGNVTIEDGYFSLELKLFHDPMLGVDYFYGRIPVSWVENDDQEGLQPRVIDFKRLIAIRDHLKSHPQLAPSIGRLMDNRIKLFDGQHKLAAQVLNNQQEVDIKVYVSPNDVVGAKSLFDALMRTNLDAHSKLKQIPFYTSTLLERASTIYRDYFDEFVGVVDAEKHSEDNLIRFLTTAKGRTTSDAKNLLKDQIKVSALSGIDLESYVAKANKDLSKPIAFDMLNKNIFPHLLFLEPSSAKFNSSEDFRNVEVQNFKIVTDILIEETGIQHWVPNTRGRTLSAQELKARRIWHKGSVLTWSPYLESILMFSLSMATTEQRRKKLYQPLITDPQREVLKTLFGRLFSHPMWDAPDGEIDSLLVSAQRQDELFKRQGLTENYVLYGRT